MERAQAFTWLDWTVIGVYFGLLVGTGSFFAWRAKRLKTAREFFAGENTMPVWAVAISILATAQSAATFTGVPEQGYTGDLRYLATNIGSIIAALILATVFIPAYYRKRVTTPYQLLESRFGPGAKLATSIAYMIGRIFASGARVFVGAIPVSLAVFGDTSTEHLAISIAAFMIFGILYTLAGNHECHLDRCLAGWRVHRRCDRRDLLVMFKGDRAIQRSRQRREHRDA